MKNWFEKKSTTNILLLGIVILLGAHLILNLPLVPIAKAQSTKAQTSMPQSTFSQDTIQSYQMALKTQNYLKSIDKNILEIKDSTNSVRQNLGVIMNCTRNTPTGEKAIAVKNIGIQ